MQLFSFVHSKQPPPQEIHAPKSLESQVARVSELSKFTESDRGKYVSLQGHFKSESVVRFLELEHVMHSKDKSHVSQFSGQGKHSKDVASPSS